MGTNRDLDEAYALCESLMDETISVDDVCSADVIQRITTILEEKIVSLNSSRTASLWLQYMKMVDILRQYIRAERTGNWALHLDAISKKCLLTWPLLGITITQNLRGCISNGCLSWRNNIQTFIDNSKKVSTW